MMATPYTDRRSLATEAYADPTRLTARTSIYDHQVPPHDLVAHVTAMLREVDGPILDAGCGPGRYARALRADRPARPVVAADLSAGMVAVAGPPALVADVTALPFRDRSFAAATALHMLYHVPVPAEALAELARVLRPGGTLLISNNARDDKREMRELHAAAARDAGVPLGVDHASRFLLDETEAAAREVFADVRRVELAGEVAVPAADPVVAFIESTASWYADESPEVLDLVRARVEAEIAATGAFRFRTRMGFLTCR
jgi:ubiquinone/menaquinone biosynthesis C-methylase UbiE